jgi:hypothetical protein
MMQRRINRVARAVTLLSLSVEEICGTDEKAFHNTLAWRKDEAWSSGFS